MGVAHSQRAAKADISVHVAASQCCQEGIASLTGAGGGVELESIGRHAVSRRGDQILAVWAQPGVEAESIIACRCWCLHSGGVERLGSNCG